MQDPKKSDEELMMNYQAGDAVAFDELYLRFSPRVYGLIRKYVRNAEAAGDIFQNTFLRIHAQRSNFKKGYLVAPWILTITKNQVFDFLRSGKRLSERYSETDVEQIASEKLEEDFKAEVSFAGLGNEQKQALQMRYMQGLTFQIIAEALDTSADNARQLVSRAIKRLRGKS